MEAEDDTTKDGLKVDKTLIRIVVVIALVFAGLVMLYYIASPYQNCLKNRPVMGGDRGIKNYCTRHTDW